MQHATVGELHTMNRTILVMTAFGNFRSNRPLTRHLRERRYENKPQPFLIEREPLNASFVPVDLH